MIDRSEGVSFDYCSSVLNMVLQKFLILAMISPTFTMALPRMVERPFGSPTCLRVEEIPDNVANVSTNDHTYTYYLGILIDVNFYWVEARDLLHKTRLNMTGRDPKEGLPIGGYEHDIQGLPGEKDKMFKIDRYDPQSSLTWADALAMEDRMYTYLFEYPFPRPNRISGLEVVARLGSERVGWARMTYDDDRYPGDCSGKEGDTEVQTS